MSEDGENELRRKFLLLERLEQAARLLGSVENWTRGRTLTPDEDAVMRKIIYSTNLLATSMPSLPYGASFEVKP